MLLLLLACGTERGPREAGEVVSLAGYVYEGPSASSETVLAEGALTFQLDDGTVADAVQPYEDYPGYWAASLPASTGYSLRVEADGAYPAVWRGRSPAADGTWFSGALFGAAVAEVDTWLAAFSLAAGLPMEALVNGEVAHVWGTAWDAEAWSCQSVRVNGEPVTCFVQDAVTGLVVPVQTGSFSWFLAPDQPPGEIVVDSGLGGVETYTAEGGDLVYAFWFVGEGT